MATDTNLDVVRGVSEIRIAPKQREGGGFIVRRPFSAAAYVDPFVMLDHMGPVEYKPGEALGAPDHPHRGQTTVTYLLQGEVDHKDSAGFQGTISTGGVQWMDAASGVVHAEMPSAKIREHGGVVEGFQLWLNLPAANKRDPPRYQDIPADSIPVVALSNAKNVVSSVKVIAGEYAGVKGPVEARTPILYWDVSLSGDAFSERIPDGYNAVAYVYRGVCKFAGEAREVHEGTGVVFGPGNKIEAAPAGHAETKFLLLAGKPIGEKIVAHGPFVMNTHDEIYEAFDDYHAGKLGKIAGAAERMAATEAAKAAQRASGAWRKEL